MNVDQMTTKQPVINAVGFYHFTDIAETLKNGWTSAILPKIAENAGVSLEKCIEICSWMRAESEGDGIDVAEMYQEQAKASLYRTKYWQKIRAEAYLKLKSEMNEAPDQWNLGRLADHWSVLEGVYLYGDNPNINQDVFGCFADIAKILNVSLKSVKYAYVEDTICRVKTLGLELDDKNVLHCVLWHLPTIVKFAGISLKQGKEIWYRMVAESVDDIGAKKYEANLDEEDKHIWEQVRTYQNKQSKV